MSAHATSRRPDAHRSPTACNEHDDGQQPDEELRREHLPERHEGHDGGGSVADEALVPGVSAREHNPHREQRDGSGDRAHGRRDAGDGPGQVLRAGARGPAERHPGGVVECDQHGRPQALDLQRPPELLPDASRHSSRRQHEEREIDGHGRPDGDRALAYPRPATAGPPRARDDEREQHGRIDLRRDRDAEDDGSEPVTATQERRQRGSGHRRRKQIEARERERAEQQEAAEEERHGDGAIARRAAQSLVADQQQQRDAGDRDDHQRRKRRVVVVLVAGEERRHDERDERARWVLDAEVAIR